MRNAILLSLGFSIFSSFAQIVTSQEKEVGSLGQRQQESTLEAILPFAEAVHLAKKGDARGCFQVALHYAKGEEIARNPIVASNFLDKAVSKDYPNAVFLMAMVSESQLDCQVPLGLRRNLNRRPTQLDIHGNIPPELQGYLPGILLSEFYAHGRFSRSVALKRSWTNEHDVTSVRALYTRAHQLGVSAATNELSRFERRIRSCQAAIREEKERTRRLAANAQLAKDLLGIDVEAINEANKLRAPRGALGELRARRAAWHQAEIERRQREAERQEFQKQLERRQREAERQEFQKQQREALRKIQEELQRAKEARRAEESGNLATE